MKCKCGLFNTKNLVKTNGITTTIDKETGKFNMFLGNMKMGAGIASVPFCFMCGIDLNKLTI